MRVETGGERLVGFPSGRPLGVVGDAGGRADEDEPVDEVRARLRERQRDPATEGVPEVGGACPPTSPTRRAVVARSAGFDLGRSTVAGEIDRTHLVRRAEVARDRVERPCRLGEAVDEDDALARAERRMRERGVRGSGATAR